MSYRDVILELITTVETIDQALLDTQHVGGGFTHNPKIGALDFVGSDRQFNLIGFGGFAGMQHNSRVTDDVDLLVDYVAPQGHNAFNVDVTIRTDFAQLVKALQNPANWPATCVIRPAGDERFPYSIEDIEGEDTRPVRRLTISFSVEHTALD